MRKMSEKESRNFTRLLIEKIEREHTKERVPTRKEMRAIARSKSQNRVIYESTKIYESQINYIENDIY